MKVTEKTLIELLRWYEKSFGCYPVSLTIPYEDWLALKDKASEKKTYKNSTVPMDQKSYCYQGVHMFPGGHRIEIQMPPKPAVGW